MYKDFEKFNFLLKDNIILIFDRICDPRNLGSCLRTAFSFGINKIILSKYYTCPINNSVLRSSSGYSKNINIIIIKNLNKFIKYLKYNYYYIIGTYLNTNNYIYNFNYNNYKNIVIIIGSESTGISKKIIKKCDLLIKIPMKNNVDSINLSVATGIILYEIIIKQNKKI
ncbi:23S rRNA (guanosine(2251)-2'-O)-methyltransferase RlmB [Candidatus Nardonella dryophthoridicola]|uniref:23S rRNA (guanosine(2251)-2'-O)-methyltransferase RlmB n=1 Tax=Candidatus Nardonella dryophthoridicola TaxID=1971485 RepID=UPI0011E5F781|nr:RNA methyltransferase [Candidatus Nardonella dryophthoridicola]QTJ62784.1 RNA methyltransferase [Candidatus Nardonella dryophthoridicola]